MSKGCSEGRRWRRAEVWLLSNLLSQLPGVAITGACRRAGFESNLGLDWNEPARHLAYSVSLRFMPSKPESQFQATRELLREWLHPAHVDGKLFIQFSMENRVL
jgi:hypothetical protein